MCTSHPRLCLRRRRAPSAGASTCLLASFLQIALVRVRSGHYIMRASMLAAVLAAIAAPAVVVATEPACASLSVEDSRGSQDDSKWKMVVVVPETTATPFVVVAVTLPHGIMGSMVSAVTGVMGYQVSEDGGKIAARLTGKSASFTLEGTGSWSPDKDGEAGSQPSFECTGLAEPPASSTCTSLGASIAIGNFWASGYIAKVRIANWQAGARFGLQMSAKDTRNVYLEKVEVDGSIASESGRWHHQASVEFHHSSGRLELLLDPSGTGAPSPPPPPTLLAGRSRRGLDDHDGEEKEEEEEDEEESRSPPPPVPSPPPPVYGVSPPPPAKPGVTITLTVETGREPTTPPRISTCSHVIMPPRSPPAVPPLPPPSPMPPLPSPPFTGTPPPAVGSSSRAAQDYLASHAKFGPCPTPIGWEVTQLHHTKLSALAVFADVKKVPPRMEVRMHTDQPTILDRVYHAVAIPSHAETDGSAGGMAGGPTDGGDDDDAPPVASTTHAFVLPDDKVFDGGGEKGNAVVVHLEFPSHVRDVAHFNLTKPAFECRVPAAAPSPPAKARAGAKPSAAASQAAAARTGSTHGVVEGDQPTAMLPPSPSPTAHSSPPPLPKLAPPSPKPLQTTLAADNSWDEPRPSQQPPQQPSQQQQQTRGGDLVAGLGQSHAAPTAADEDDEDDDEDDESMDDADALAEALGMGEQGAGEDDRPSSSSSSSSSSSTGTAAPAPPSSNRTRIGLLLGGAVALLAGGLMLMRGAFQERRTQSETKARRERAIEEAERAEPELLPEIRPEDVAASERAGSVKVHIELPNGEIVSVRIKRRRLGATFGELCATLVQAAPEGALTIAHLEAHYDMQYEDKEGRMVALAKGDDVGALVNDAQALFVSKQAKRPTAAPRMAQGPRQLTAC